MVEEAWANGGFNIDKSSSKSSVPPKHAPDAADPRLDLPFMDIRGVVEAVAIVGSLPHTFLHIMKTYHDCSSSGYTGSRAFLICHSS